MENTTQTTSAHTPLPWDVFDDDCPSVVALIGKQYEELCEMSTVTPKIERKANAEFIVRACNNHELLLETCSDLLIGIKNGTVHLPQTYVDQLEEVTAKANGNDPKPAETSNQFRYAKTGLSDENGDSLYEGDVVEDVDDKTLGVVRWANGSFHLCTNPDASGEWWELLSDTCNTVRKVGNVIKTLTFLPMEKLPEHHRLDTVLQYAGMGFKPIPLLPGTKTACVKWKRLQTESPTEKEYREWFSKERNVALVCGDIVVVDCDSAEAVDQVLAHCGATPMRTATPTPGHMHLYYRARKGVEYGNAVKIKGKPIDLRALGAYAVAPWSVNDQGVPYRWVGEVVPVKELPLIKVGFLRERKPKPVRKTFVISDSRRPGDAIKDIMAYIRRIPSVQGQYGNKGLMRVCYLLAERFPFDEALGRLECWNADVPLPSWPQEELVRALSSAFKRKIQEGLR